MQSRTYCRLDHKLSTKAGGHAPALDVGDAAQEERIMAWTPPGSPDRRPVQSRPASPYKALMPSSSRQQVCWGLMRLRATLFS